ncbi:hypothetical protein J3Q64DRAFT_1859347 [Phycomyces blakesleeanus]|uniref:AMP-dependent synthetase/ligase domain-containing protein n=1 Tax=Phycomyces blakesleeanus TaxID=4837 RepID=A0ABR3BGT1_PHYBL
MYYSLEPNREYPHQSVFEALFEGETTVPGDKKLLIDSDNPENYLTRDALKRDILLFAQGLKDKFDFRSGDILAICAPNHLDCPIALHGPTVIGAITACIQSEEGSKNILKDMSIAKPKLVIAHKETLQDIKFAANSLGLEDTRILLFGNEAINGIKPFRDVLMNHSTLATPIRFTPSELKTLPAYLYYTSGTTGPKKAVVITAPWITPGVRFLSYGSNAHCSSLIISLSGCIRDGTEVYIMKSFTLKRMCEAVQRYKIHSLVIHPWVASALAKELFVENYDLSSLHASFSVGSALDPMTVVQFKKRFGITLCTLYGMTECISSFVGSSVAMERGSLGTLSPGFEAKIIDEDNKEVTEGSVGELCIKSHSITPGYYNNHEATAALIDKDGFLHSGDIFRVDPQGYFYYVGRQKDMIKYYSYQISPSDIEDILISHPYISECCVVGFYSSKISTEVPKAFVVVAPSQRDFITANELRAYADDRLPDQMHLRGGVILIDSLPRSAVGKVLRNSLRHQMGQRTVNAN